MKTFILLSLVSFNCFAVKIDIFETSSLLLDEVAHSRSRSYELSLNEIGQVKEGKIRVKCGEDLSSITHPNLGLLKGQSAVINAGEAIVHCR